MSWESYRGKKTEERRDESRFIIKDLYEQLLLISLAKALVLCT